MFSVIRANGYFSVEELEGDKAAVTDEDGAPAAAKESK